MRPAGAAWHVGSRSWRDGHLRGLDAMALETQGLRGGVNGLIIGFIIAATTSLIV